MSTMNHPYREPPAVSKLPYTPPVLDSAVERARISAWFRARAVRIRERLADHNYAHGLEVLADGIDRGEHWHASYMPLRPPPTEPSK